MIIAAGPQSLSDESIQSVKNGSVKGGLWFAGAVEESVCDHLDRKSVRWGTRQQLILSDDETTVTQ